MTNRLSRSNSQSDLPNYGQGQQDDKNKDVGKKKDGATAQSDKNTGQGHSDKNKAEPQMKSKEKKEKAPVKSDSNDGGVGYGDNFGNILFGDKQGGSGTNNIVEKTFLGAKPSQVAQKFENDGDSSSKDDAGQSDSNTPTSPRQQQPDKKEKTTNNKASKAFLKNFGSAIASIASDRREMAISPREKKRETHRNTHRNTQDSNSSISNTAESGGTTTTNTTATSREKVTFTDILKKYPDQPVSSPQELARITISAESNEGKIHLTKTTAKTMSRSSTPTYQGKPLAAHYRTPFLRSCFLKPNLITIIEDMQENYIAIKKTGNLESESLRKKAESVWHASENKLDSVLSHKSLMTDFSGITKSYVDKINGPASNISTSHLPARFLHFLLELDREIVRWHQQTPDGPEKLSDVELRDVRRNALSNYLGIYGPYATIKVVVGEIKSEKNIYDKESPYVLLENVLGKKTSEQYDEFLSSAMDCDEEQYSKIKERSNQEQERVAKDIEARKTTSMLQTNSHLTQSNHPGNAHSNSSTTTTTTATTTTTTTTIPVSDPEQEKNIGGENDVLVSDLTNESKATIYRALKEERNTAAQLAELIICAESQGGRKAFSASKIHTILRGPLKVKGLEDPSNPQNKIDVNIVDQVVFPYLKSHFMTKEMEELRGKTFNAYKNCANERDALSKKLNLTGGLLRKHEEFQKLVNGEISFLYEQVFGDNMALASSRLPDPIKLLLLEIDAYVIKWGEKSGNTDAALLRRARMSAISAYVAVRSFPAVWSDNFVKIDRLKNEEFSVMNSVITNYLTTKIDKFYDDVMAYHDNEHKNNKISAANSLRSNSLIEKNKSSSKLEKEGGARQQQLFKKRERVLNKFFKDLNFKEAGADFFEKFKNHVMKIDQDKYKVFQNNPEKFAFNFLQEYRLLQLDNVEMGDQSLFDDTPDNLKNLEGRLKNAMAARELPALALASGKATMPQNESDSSKTSVGQTGNNVTNTTTTNTTTANTTTTTTTNTNPNQASSEEEDSSPRKQ